MVNSTVSTGTLWIEPPERIQYGAVPHEHVLFSTVPHVQVRTVSGTTSPTGVECGRTTRTGELWVVPQVQVQNRAVPEPCTVYFMKIMQSITHA